jgi:MFS transporter, DHA1 family, inner membrane transport protein
MPLSILSLMLVVFSLSTGEFVIAGILPDVAAGLSVSVAAAGLLVTSYAVGMIIGGPVVTALTARLARKPLIAGLIGLSVLANLGSVLAPDYAVLLLVRFAAGVPVATFFAVAIATAVSMTPPGKAASTVAKVALGLNLGIILGTPIGTFIGHSAGWRFTFLAVAAASVIALVMVLRFVPAQPAAAATSAFGELRVLTDRSVQLAIGLTAVGNLGVIMVYTYIAPLLTHVSRFTAGTVPVLLLAYGTGAVAGNFLGGWLADKALMPSLAGLLTLLAAALALLWLVSPIEGPAAVLTFVIGMLAFAIIPGMQTHVLATASAAPTLAVAVNASGFQLAAAFAGWLGGIIITSSLGTRSLYLAGALITAVGVAIALCILRRAKTTPTPTTANVAARDTAQRS